MANPASSPRRVFVSAIGARTALALCGFTAVVGQIVLMRELIQVFNGNEIAFGVLLATWLLWTAVGSALAGASRLRHFRPRLTVAILESLIAASLPATIWALRNAKALFQAVPGELVGTVPMLVTSLVCLSVFCVMSGALFAAAARMVERECALSTRAAASTAYLVEAAGSALGGILASVVLVRWCDAFQIAMVAGLLNICVAVSLLLRLKRTQVAVLGAAALIAAAPLLFWLAPRWDREARAQLWRGFHVVGARESIYGNLTVTETGNEAGAIRSLYENGEILANAPDPAAAEEAVDYALLEHPAPRRVLLIGGGLNGGVAELLKHHSITSLDYVELDPALIQMAREYFPVQTVDTDSRVHLHFLDGRLFLAETGEKFDVIIVGVPDPQTAQLNRFYTAEFFQLARAHLEPGGLVAIQLRSSEEAISPDLAAFLQSMRRTLGEVFPYQAVIPGETVHLFGALDPGTLTSDPQVLLARLRERKLATQYVREYFIPYRMAQDRMQLVAADLAPTPTTPVNRDFTPIAYAFDVVLWGAQFKSRYRGVVPLGRAHCIWPSCDCHIDWARRRRCSARASARDQTPQAGRSRFLGGSDGIHLDGFADFSAARIPGSVRVCLHRTVDSHRLVHGWYRTGSMAGNAPFSRTNHSATRGDSACPRARCSDAATSGHVRRPFLLRSRNLDRGADRISRACHCVRPVGWISICHCGGGVPGR